MSRDLATWLLLAGVYALAGKLGLALAFVNASATAVWPPTGIALAAILVLGPRVWPGILLGAFFVNETTSGSLWMSLAIAAGNTCEAVIAGHLVNRFVGWRSLLHRGRGLVVFVMVAALASTAISTTVGVTSLSWAGFAAWSEYGRIWLTWWLGDAVGAIVVAPVLLLWATQGRPNWSRAQMVELSLVVVVLVGVGWAVFVATDYPIGFLTLPVVIWAGFRFGQREAATVTCVLSVLATWATVHGHGSFAATQSPNAALLALQLYMAVTSVVGLAVGGAVAGRQQAEAAIRRSHADLESAVDARTRELQTAVEQLRTIIDAEPACVKLVSSEGLLLDMNPAGLEMIGADNLSQVAGRPIIDLVHPADRSLYIERHLAASNGSPTRWEFRIIGLDGGERWVDSHMVPFETSANEDKTLPAVLGVTSDVTERKRLEDQLRQSQKMDALGRLAGGITHDFNNFLTALIGYTELALKQIGDDETIYPDLKNDLSEVLKVGRRAAALTRQLLIFSRSPMLEPPQAVSFDAVIAPLNGMLKQLLGDTVRLQSSLRSGDTRVRIDPRHLEQVVVNLATNARDAMRQGGELTIETSVVHLDDAYAAGKPAHPLTGSYVQLAVSDTGVGMDENTKAHLFEPFFTTKAAGEGTGLGLAMVYGIVKQSGGYIWVYSEPGRGTTFKLYFPLVPELPAVHVEPRAPEPADEYQTILVVDDDEHVRAVARDVLRENGFRVLEARTGEEANQLAMEFTGAIHLLVTDVIMPGMTGGDLVVRLRRSRPALCTLFMSGYGPRAIAHHGLLDANAILLEKPFTSDQLLFLVRSMLESAGQPSH
jgi:PAS domain S-box-containing protein